MEGKEERKEKRGNKKGKGDEKEVEENLEKEEENRVVEIKEAKTEGKERRRKDNWETEDEDGCKKKEVSMESERGDEEVLVVGKVVEVMGAMVWEYEDCEAEGGYVECAVEDCGNASEKTEKREEGQTVENVSLSYTWDIYEGIFSGRKDASPQRRRRRRGGEHCMENPGITNRYDECRASYHEREEEEKEEEEEGEKACYVFSDNTCVVCTRVVFTGQCIYHK